MISKKVQSYWEHFSQLGYVFQINASENLESAFKNLLQLKKKTNRPISLVIRFAGPSPAVASFDNKKLITRLKRAIFLQKKYSFIDLQLDTFVSVDRGYHPRTGLIDRLSNFTNIGKSLIF